MSVQEIELTTPSGLELSHDELFNEEMLKKESKPESVPIMSAAHISTPIASPAEDASMPEDFITLPPNAQDDDQMDVDDLFGDNDVSDATEVGHNESAEKDAVSINENSNTDTKASDTQESLIENVGGIEKMATLDSTMSGTTEVDAEQIDSKTSDESTKPIETLESTYIQKDDPSVPTAEQDSITTLPLSAEPAELSSETHKHIRSSSPSLDSSENPSKRIKTEGFIPNPGQLPPTPTEPRSLHSSPMPDDARNPPPGAAVQPMPKHQVKFALASLRAVKRLRDAGPFLAPVDIVKLNIPTYLDFVKNPMDLGTMERKINANEYTSVSDFMADMNLIVSNCEIFNGIDSEISTMARNIRTSFDKHMKNMPPYEQSLPASKPKRKSLPPVSTPKSQRVAAANAAAAAAVSSSSPLNSVATPTSKTAKGSADSKASTMRRESTADGRPKREIHPPRSKDLPYDMSKPRRRKLDAELKFCGTVLKELTNKRHEAYSFPFLEPVDPVALNCPAYLSIIKEPMDLSTISKKYNSNQYTTAEEFEADVRLIFHNCYIFNPEGAPVNMMGHRLEALFDKKWQERPLAAPTPPPGNSSDDESEYDSDDHLALSSNPAIKFLEEQLDRMKKELIKLKKDAIREARDQKSKRVYKKKTTRKTSTGGRGKSGPGRKTSGPTSLDAPEHMSYSMKKELIEILPSLPQSKMATALAIISEKVTVDYDENGNVELDMEKLPQEILMSLYKYLVLNEERRPTVSNGNDSSKRATKAKKGKPLSEAEQSRQIEEIQKKIEQFDRVESGGVMVSSDEDDDDDDDDDGSSDSSSEEE